MDLYCFFDAREHHIIELCQELRKIGYDILLPTSKKRNIGFKELKKTIEVKFELPHKYMIIFRFNNIQIEKEHLEKYPFYFKLQTGFSLVTAIDTELLDEINKSEYQLSG